MQSRFALFRPASGKAAAQPVQAAARSHSPRSLDGKKVPDEAAAHTRRVLLGQQHHESSTSKSLSSSVALSERPGARLDDYLSDSRRVALSTDSERSAYDSDRSQSGATSASLFMPFWALRKIEKDGIPVASELVDLHETICAPKYMPLHSRSKFVL